jgi:putative transposase
MEPEAECIPVVIGATPEGRKELVGFHVGTREWSAPLSLDRL